MPEPTRQPPPVPPTLGYIGPTPPPPPPPIAFSGDHLAAVADARRRFRPIRRQLSVANFDAWSVAIFAGLTVAFGLTSPPALFVGLAMGAVAFVEFRAIKRLQQLDPLAARTLAINQFCFAAALIAYGLYNLLAPPPALSADLKDALAGSPEMAQMMNNMSSLISQVLYGGVIAFALIFQCGSGLYHLTRIRTIRQYRDSIPPFIQQMHNAGLMR